jgi:hypothetical protein
LEGAAFASNVVLGERLRADVAVRHFLHPVHDLVVPKPSHRIEMPLAILAITFRRDVSARGGTESGVSRQAARFV